MDLFIDKYYQNSVENKINYYDFLYASSDSLSNYDILGTYQFSFKSGGAILVRSTTIDDVHIKNEDGEFLQEFKISSDMKKFVDADFS
jgi:hypothetical protein